MRIKQKTFVIIALFAIGFCIIFFWQNINKHLSSIKEVKNNPYISSHISINKESKYELKINNKTWLYKQQHSNKILNAYLIFQDDCELNNADYHHSELKIKISAIGCVDNKNFDRLILNKNYPDSVILLRNLEDYSKTYYLGLINNFSEEELIFTLEVLTPDAKLNRAKPRICINSYEYVHSDYGYKIASFVYSFVMAISLLTIILLIIFFLILTPTAPSKTNLKHRCTIHNKS